MKPTRIASLLVLSLSLAGCAATPLRLYGGLELPVSQVAILKHNCNGIGKAVLEEATGSRYFGTPEVNRVDGVSSQTSFGMRYNSRIDGGFNLHLLPGKHNIELSADLAAAIGVRPRVKVSFDAMAGHEYCVVQAFVYGGRHSQGSPDERGAMWSPSGTLSSYKWQPLLVDQTVGKLLYPEKPWRAE